MADADPAPATVVMVLYRNPTIDLSWVPDDAPVILVHNDRELDVDSVRHPAVGHVYNDANVGFGAAVNQAAARARTRRLLLCNPDAVLGRSQWDALAGGSPDELRTLPLVDTDGRPTSVVNPYPSPVGLLATGLRLGRYAPRDGVLRRLAARTGRGWIGENARSFTLGAGRWPLSERWVSGAVLALDRVRFGEIGGFDEGYFLYFEDVDLCRRWAARFPDTTAVVVEADPGIHAVGQSSRGGARSATDEHHARSALRYARSQPRSPAWLAVAAVLALRVRWLELRS